MVRYRTSVLWFAILLVGLMTASVSRADVVEIPVRMVDENRPVGMVQAVDSWFTTLATLIFDISDMPPGRYQVALHQGEDCGQIGPVYDPVSGAVPLGAFPDFDVAADGSTPRTIGLKPPELTAGSRKITVLEMREHLLVFHRDGAPAACGLIPARVD